MPYVAKLSNAGGAKSLTRYVGMLAGNAEYTATSFESIATVTVGAGGSSAITFSSIPQTYQHLQLRGIEQQFYGVNDRGYTAIRFNGDSGTNYTREQLWGTGGSANPASLLDNSYAYCGFSLLIGNTSPRTQWFASNVIDILDYSNTNKFTTVRGFGGGDVGANGDTGFVDSLWKNTAAVTSITFPNINGNFQQNTTYALYGIKG
jgi:hypothetical protein